MKKIRAQFPEVSTERLLAVARIVVNARNAVAACNKSHSRATWGLACLHCEASRIAVVDAVNEQRFPWLGYRREQGQAYTVFLGHTPLRVQPDDPEIRPVMLHERAALKRLAWQQQELFAVPEPGSEFERHAILRLEVSQSGAEPVDFVILRMLDENSGRQFDEWQVYSADQGGGAGAAGGGGEPGGGGSSSGEPFSLATPPQDVASSEPFEFEADQTDAEDDEQAG